MRKKLRLLVSLCALSGFYSLANAQSIGDVIQSASGDYKAYKVIGENLITNGSFDDGVDGWYNGSWSSAVAADYVISETGGFDGGAYISLKSNNGKDSPMTLRNHAQVDLGKTYMFLCYTGGSAPTSNNLQYNALWSSTDGTTEGNKLYELKWNGSWTQNTFVFTPEEYTWVCMRNSWTSDGSSLDGVFIGEVEETPNITKLQEEINKANESKDAFEEYVAKLQLEKHITEAKKSLSSDAPEVVVEAIKILEEAVAQTEILNETLGELRVELAMANQLGVNDVAKYETLLTDEAVTIETLSVAVSDLKVAQYNTVGENYALDVTELVGDVSSWEGDMVTAKGQHWDGTGSSTYWEQTGDQWNSSAWTVYKETKATLPAGKYVLKFTGRSSDGVSAYVSVNDKKVYLPCKGDKGYGVDVEGKANFSADGTYANNNAGRGWEWRFMPFELTEESEVAFKIYAEANTTHQWVSVTSVSLSKMFSKSEAKAELNSLCDIADDLLQKPIYVGIKEALSSALTTVQEYLLTSTDDMTVEECNKYIQLLNDNIASAESSVAYYESVNALLEKYSTIAESYNATDAYNEKVASIKTAYEEGTLEEKENIEADIRMIMQSSVASTVDNGDITGILVNPSFEEGSSAWSNGWTTDRNTTGNFDYHLNTTNPAEGSVSLNAWADQINYINVLQSVKLPEGIYTLTAQVRTNVTPLEEGTSVKAIVGDKEYNSNYMTYNLPDGVEWNGQEAWQTLKVTFIVPEEQTVTVGIYSKGNNRGSDHAGWFQVDNFRLYVENSYTRSTVTGNYGTICLPYAFELNDCEGIENIYKVSEMTTENAVISSVDAIEAGQPCIFKANADAIKINMSERNVVAEPLVDAYLVGTFVNIPKLVHGTYVLSGQSFYFVNSDVKADAFRCYFKPLFSGIKNFGFVEDEDGTVGINGIENDGDMNDAVIYDLTGRRVKSPVRGVYIVNGKKMVVNNLK